MYCYRLVCEDSDATQNCACQLTTPGHAHNITPCSRMANPTSLAHLYCLIGSHAFKHSRLVSGIPVTYLAAVHTQVQTNHSIKVVSYTVHEKP